MKYIFDWYPARMSPEEKKLVKKLDFALVGFGAVAFFLKYLDSSNINNAYVSGLKEALNIQKEEYAWFGFFYYIGYMVFQIPTLLYISRPGVARWLLPGVEVRILTFGQVIIHNVEQVYVIRFFLGALAIPSYTGVNYVLGSWYRGDELFKRSAVFMVGNSLGQMFSGYLQAGAYKGLDGKLGLRGYQWIFIIDAIITIPVAIVGLIFFPGLPSGKRIWWMREDEQLLAQKRMRDDGVATSKKITLKTFTDILKSWHIYLCTAMITVFLIETYPAGQMTLWLKSVMKADGTPKYSIELINTIPTGIFAIIAVTTFFTGSLAGIWNIWVMLAVIQGVNLFAVTVLRVWTVPDDLKWTAYFMLGFMGAPNPLFFGWINRLTKRNAEERAVVMGSVFCFGWAFFAWIPLVTYKTTEAPRWTKG
ncbi:major facilitator superfamily domain-containing protein [Mrakia frigida]|uniref:major facilitator superfamily domain-containing protein n=1 Tax=Mrakia frigida TaxID=29902 RepID=UPI003FCC0DB5